MIRRCMVLLAAMLLSFTAHADRWRVDILIVSDRNYGFSEQENALAPSIFSGDEIIPVEDRNRLAAHGIRMLPANDSILDQQWSRLANSQRFEPILRLAWVQQDPPRHNGPSLLLRHGEVLRDPAGAAPLHRLEGTLRLTLRRFLHLHADLEWRRPMIVDSPGSEAIDQIGAVTLSEERRMRSKTLHYLDGPGFGILAHVLPLEEG